MKTINTIQTTTRSTLQTEPYSCAGERCAQHTVAGMRRGTARRKADASLAIKFRNVAFMWGAIVAPACAIIDEPGLTDEASGRLNVWGQALDHAGPISEEEEFEMVEESQPAVASEAADSMETDSPRERQACLNDGAQPPPPVVRVPRETPETARHHFAEESLLAWLDVQRIPEDESGRFSYDELLQAMSDLDVLRMAGPVGEHSLRSQPSAQSNATMTEAADLSAAKLSGLFPND